MKNLSVRLLAIIVALTLAIPVFALAADGNYITASLNKTEFNKGDTLVLDWSFDGHVVRIDSMHVGIFVEYTDESSTVPLECRAYIDQVDRDKETGSYSLYIDGSFFGKGYMQFSYKIWDSNDIFTQKVPFTINRPAETEDYCDFSLSKHPLDWKAGDVVSVEWDINYPVKREIAAFYVSMYTYSAADGGFTLSENSLLSTEPGKYEITIPDSEVPGYGNLMEVVISYLAYADDNSEMNVQGKYDCIVTDIPELMPSVSPTVPAEEPTQAPTAAPTTQAPTSAPTEEVPTNAPTDIPTSVPTDAPTAAPTATPTAVPVKSVKLNLDAITIGAKQTVDTVKVVEGSNITWTSSNEKVAAVDADGKIKGVKKGTATITATDDEGNSDSVEVTVVAKNKGVTKVKLSKKKATLKQGEKLALKATLTPADAKNKKIIWTSSNTAVATVNAKGKVKAVGVGEAVITATASSGKTATCKITVTGAKVKKITIEGAKKMKVGETQQLIAKIAPEFAENKDVKWKSSAKKIAAVDENGVVTAIKKGTVTITATAKDGSKVKATFTIKIKK